MKFETNKEFNKYVNDTVDEVSVCEGEYKEYDAETNYANHYLKDLGLI